LVNRGTVGVNSLPKTVTRQRRGCNLNPGPSAPEPLWGMALKILGILKSRTYEHLITNH